ncbi:hypothetical protein ACFLQ2_05220 [archaeon]
MAKCPYCKIEIKIDELKEEKKGFGLLKQEVMHSCPHCDCILSISRGKYG